MTAKKKRAARPAGETFAIDELARRAGTTVRNVRAYQDRRLLPKPTRRGRAGVYSGAHLGRLRLIGQLLARGYSLGNIAELIAAWEAGRDLEQLMGFEAAVAGPFVAEEPAVATAAELARTFTAEPAMLRAAIELGLVEVDQTPGRFRVPSPKTLAAGAELVAAGIPIADTLEAFRLVRRDMEGLARRLVALVVEHLLGGCAQGRLPRAADLRALAEKVWRLRPVADAVASAELARALERAAKDQLGERMDRILAELRAGSRAA